MCAVSTSHATFSAMLEMLRMRTTPGRPNAGILTEWDSFKYKITDCPIGCQPGDDCKTKDPPGCEETGTITVTILIGNPSGMRAKSKSYSLLEDRVLQTGLVDPLDPDSGVQQ
eukprot:scaffold429394_cov41-Prasinocladus_malaysianus.AAC.1